MSNNKRRVVVTGLGTLSPNGMSTEAFWQALLNGESGISYIERFDTTDFRVHIGAELQGFNPENFGISRKEARRTDLCTQYALATASMALEDAGLDPFFENPERVGVIYGSGIGGIITFEDQHTKLMQQGPRRISPFFIPMMIPDMTSGQVSIQFGARGPNYTTVSACASATHAIGNACREIWSGAADIMITGGSEAPISPMSLGGFASMRALSTRNDEPKRASRPFDADRDGFILGEGGGGLILEELGHAIARNARIYGEIVGIGYTGDAFHQTDMLPGGKGGVRAMQQALRQAGLRIEDIDYINAHGTSTPAGDLNETAAIKTVFGDHARNLAVSSTKSMTGHLLGASGAIETIASLLSIYHNQVPPTINYENPDPECELDFVPNTARKMEVEVAMNNSFGFGGHNAVLALRKFRQ